MSGRAPERRRRLLWFLAYYAMGLGAVAAVAYGLRLWIA